MGLDRYGARRARFTYRNCLVNKSAPNSHKALTDCKDQRPFGGKCAFFSVCTSLEANQRLKTGNPCPELSWQDLEGKVKALTDVDKSVINVVRCLIVLQRTGVCYASPVSSQQDTLKIKDFEIIATHIPHKVNEAIKKYMKAGPMVGIFEVFGDGFDKYGHSTSVDDIYVVKAIPEVGRWLHAVCISGFGIQGPFPFWEFQNSYGPLWRGPARGFGLVYAVHLRWLYGFTLA